MRTGIAEMGQGSASTVFAQIAAEELNVPYSAITQVVIGDTDRTPGGGIAAGFMFLGAPNIRNVAAYIYQSLLKLASTQLGVPVGEPDGLERRRSRAAARPSPTASSSPGQSLNLTIPVTGDPTSFLGLTVLGNPPTKPIADYAVVGQSIPMRTIPPIVTGTATYVGDVRLPGMLHARVGASARARRERWSRSGRSTRRRSRTRRSSSRATSSAVVDPEEYTAIQAASLLARKTKWTTWAGPAGERQPLRGDASARLDLDATRPTGSTSATRTRRSRAPRRS